MTRYAAFLRGVSPMNCKMADLKRMLEGAGFDDVVTVLSSGNAVFSCPAAAPGKLERTIEAATEFATFVRPIGALEKLLAAEPFDGAAPGAKRIVTFLRAAPKKPPKLPIELDGARILAVRGTEVLSAYLPTAKGPVFMTLLEKTFGKDVTTRTWDTVGKVARK